ncbi:D-alanyl-D-alanine carboxypeptidase/D-alanyl-D-alanine-endopeptidase [Flavobacteriaceae bacterium M23B6Z8]
MALLKRFRWQFFHHFTHYQESKLLFLIIPVFVLSCSSPKTFIEKKLEKAQIEKYFVGFELFDPATQQVLFARNAHTYFNPASNTKIFTLFSALTTLNDSLVAFKYHEQGDTLFIKPAGDPTFLHPEFDSQRTIDFLRSVNVSTISIIPDLLLDDPYAPGWAWEDYGYAFMPQRSALPLYGNVVTIFQNDSLVVKPAIFASDISFQKEKYPRELTKNLFFISEELKDTIHIPFLSSPELSRKLLENITLKNIEFTPKAPENPWFIRYSHPVDSVLIPMMINSDNFLAEQLMMAVSAVNRDSLSVQDAIEYTLDSLLPNLPDKPRWVDGSGLSRYNLFTPNSFVHVLHKLYDKIPDKKKLFAYFPAGGVNGTLKEWYGGEQSFIFAKSGSFSNNYCLSGYLITKTGKTLIFSFMANHFTIPSREVKKELEILLSGIRDRY